MRPGIFAILLLSSILQCASPAAAAEVGLFLDWGLSSTCPLSKFVPPVVNIQIREFELPIAAVHFSLEFSSGITWYPPLVEWWTPVTGELEDLTIRFEECRPASSLHQLDLFFFTHVSEEREVVCMGPPSSATTDPPAIIVETCDGQLFNLEFTGGWPSEVPPGCLWLCEIVPVIDPSWGMLKASF